MWLETLTAHFVLRFTLHLPLKVCKCRTCPPVIVHDHEQPSSDWLWSAIPFAVLNSSESAQICQNGWMHKLETWQIPIYPYWSLLIPLFLRRTWPCKFHHVVLKTSSLRENSHLLNLQNIACRNWALIEKSICREKEKQWVQLLHLGSEES